MKPQYSYCFIFEILYDPIGRTYKPTVYLVSASDHVESERLQHAHHDVLPEHVRGSAGVRLDWGRLGYGRPVGLLYLPSLHPRVRVGPEQIDAHGRVGRVLQSIIYYVMITILQYVSQYAIP